MDSIISVDEFLFSFINKSLSSGLLDAILIPIRHKLFWIPLYLFIIVFVSINLRKERWLIYLFFGVTIFLSDTTSSKFIKKSVERIRPCHNEKLEANVRIPCSYGFSFTSSHATNHFAIGTFLFFLFAAWKKRWLFFLWAGMISIAQVYVGVHYPFDVIAGAIIGILLGTISFRIFNYFRKHFQTIDTNVVHNS